MHKFFLQQALSQAKHRQGFCAPNPAVGAVIVKDNQVLARGYHWAAGHPHAEVVALEQLSHQAEGATLYVTLEPCCHWGKTPPCTDLLIQSRLAKVVYAYQDPNPQVAGRGAAALKAAGIEVEQITSKAIDEFYISYQHWRKTGLPRVTAKLAISLDSKIADAKGNPVCITDYPLQQFTHICRRRADAILTTVATVINDNPQLNVRLDDQEIAKPLYILDSNLSMPLTARIFQTGASITVFHAAACNEQRRKSFEQRGIRCIQVERTAIGLDLHQVLKIIGQDGMHDLWIEAGGQCFHAFAAANLLQRAFVYVAAKFLGAAAYPAFHAHNDLFAGAKHVSWRAIGKDAVCEVSWDG